MGTSSNGTSGSMDDYLNRITAIQDGSTNLAQYTYLGLGTVIRIAYAQPQVWLDLWGGTSGVFNGLDLFSRIIDQRWQNNTGSTPTDIDRYQYGYDQNSNRLWKANLMTTGLDEFYAYDQLNRLTLMQRGTLNGTKTGITGTPVREMDYTLDPTGNWSAYLTKTSGTTDLNQTRTANKVNEITGITSTPTWAAPAYDAAGNMTTMPQPASPGSSFTSVYDAWNRPVSISSGGTTVATYKYDGRNRRIVKFTASSSETRHFYYTNEWQDVEERTGSPATMERQYVWGIRFIDELVCRDRTSERYYASQDANFNLTSIIGTSGAVAERYVFDPYGTRTIMNSSWSVISSSAYAWVIGHQGLIYDLESWLVSNRRRFLHPQFGRFNRRDPSGYRNGLDLYEYCGSLPTSLLDPYGSDIAFFEFTKCYDACLNNNNPLGALGRYMLDTLAAGNALRVPIPVPKSVLADFAREVLGDEKLAGQIAANAAREGADQMGSLQKFVQLAIRSGKGAEAANFFSKLAKATGVLSAVAAVVDLAVHTHCIAFCCALTGYGQRYDPKQDHMIDDWIKEYFSKQPPFVPATGQPAPAEEGREPSIWEKALQTSPEF